MVSGKLFYFMHIKINFCRANIKSVLYFIRKCPNSLFPIYVKMQNNPKMHKKNFHVYNLVREKSVYLMSLN